MPIDTEPAFAFHPGLPDRQPIKGPQRFDTTIPKAPAMKAPANLEDVAFWRVVDLAPLVKSRAISSTDLTKMYLARMQKYSPKLLCLITSTEELALQQAAAADKEIKAGHYRGPLHGIPFGLKDLFDTKGILTTFGAEPYQTRVAEKDATVVERLRNAGAVLMAKLSMGALAQGGLWFKGMTKTPWNTEQTSSGSSAGSASSTAAGLVGFSLGTETLGSIISPSQACGTVGLRPTYGRISRYGAMALSWTMDKVGPICRGVEDCAIVLNAVYGPDGRDRTVGADPFHWEPRKPLSSLRVGILQKDFDRAQGEQKKIWDQAIEDLKKAGVKMTPTEFVEDGPTIRFLLSAEAAAAFDDITRDGQVRNLRGQAPGDWPNTLPHVAPDSGGGVHTGAARAHAVDREIRKVHGGLGRARDAAEFAADHDQPDGESAGGDEVRVHGSREGGREQGAGAAVDQLPGQDLRRGLAPARGAGLRAGDGVAQETSHAGGIATPIRAATVRERTRRRPNPLTYPQA